MNRGWRVLSATALGVGACTSFGNTRSAPPDAGLESSTDAAADVEGDASSTHFCSTPHLLCDDFDVGVLGAAPPWLGLPPAPELSASSEESVSAPKSLRVSVDSDAGPTTAFLEAHVARPLTTLTCDLDVLFAEVAGAPGSFVRVRTSKTASDFREITLYVSGGSLIAEVGVSTSADGGTLRENYVTLGLVSASKQWHHVQIVMNPSQGIVAASASDIGSTPTSTYDTLDAIASADVSVGILTPGGSWKLYFDDVSCDATP